MENTMYIALSKQMTLRTHMEQIANNIANMNTPGYKAGKVLFKEYVESPRRFDEDISMVLDFGTYRVADNGPIKMTGNPFDVAIEGKGYFGVEGANGETLYTRMGSFTLNADRQLMTPDAKPVLDVGGSAITIPADQHTIGIDERGLISGTDGPIAQLMLQEFENIQTLKAVGNSLYRADPNDPGEPSTTTRVIQSALEGSNTQSILEMTNMIDVSRKYQSVSKILQSEHDRVRSLIRTLSEA